MKGGVLMRVSAINNQVFGARLSGELLEIARKSAKTPMQQEYLEKRIEEISNYGDDETIIDYKYNSIPIAGDGVSIYATNSKLPDRLYPPTTLHLPVYRRCEHHQSKFDVQGHDIVNMITPNRVFLAEKMLFKDSVRDNKLKPKEVLAQLNGEVANDTYRAFQMEADKLTKVEK